jgi:hypothetical protein
MTDVFQILMTAINLKYRRLTDGEQKMQMYKLTEILHSLQPLFFFEKHKLNFEHLFLESTK